MKKISFSSAIAILIIVVFGLGIFLASAKPARAIPVEDISASIWRTVKDVLTKSGSKIVNNVLRTSLNQLAYDYATYLGSGAPGQKPFFQQKSLTQRLQDAGDAALGQFVEEVSKVPLTNKEGQPIKVNGQAIGGINLCSPNYFALQQITLGLTASRPEFASNNCTFSQLKANWTSAYDQIASIVNDKNYLQKLGSYFDPGGSDVAVAFELFNIRDQYVVSGTEKIKNDQTENNGWIRVQSLVGGKYANAPDSATREAQQQMLLKNNLYMYTGDALVDASNIFLNQLALTAFNKLMRNIGSYSNDSSSNSLNNPYAQNNNGGELALQNKLNSIVQATFSDQTDYDILSQLISCPSTNNNVSGASLPGPTNCVITQDFSTAISKKMTVIEAIKAGYLNPNYPFGFKGANNEEPAYNQGYPYRSMIILRKYRILPVGWELAAQFIQKNNKSTDNPKVNTENITLKDLINCFDPCDEYTGYNDGTNVGQADCQKKTSLENWCTGLVDPNWVLKVPKMYCGAKGYGPEIQYSQYNNLGKFCSANQAKSCVGDCSTLGNNANPLTCCSSAEGTCEDKNVLSVTRNGEYCADEQSCIKENSDGSCAYYGYCTEEKRRWVFNQNNSNECKPINNTCQTFTNSDNKTVSYLENTLDYNDCNANQVGCAQYAYTGTYNTTNQSVSWNTNNGARYFNKNASDCDQAKEGCHEFIRTKDNLDTNLVADGSFENPQCITTNSQQEESYNNSLIKSASAQTAGNCQIYTINAPGGYLSSPNNRWYIKADGGSVKAGITTEQKNHGSQSLYIEGPGALYSQESAAPSLLPSGFTFESERFYTLSVQVYVVSGSVTAGFGYSGNGQSATSTATGSWQNLLITYYRPTNGATDFYIKGNTDDTKFYIDSVKLAIGSIANTYTDYFANNVIYEKLLPNYLEATCYDSASRDSYQLKADAPSICNNFARKCGADEVGCVKYTNNDTGLEITGKVKPKDVCPGSCVGYDVFVEQPTNFSASQSAYFIPKTAKTCNAQVTGCTAFTNLDKLSQGGEAVENYSYLRTCIKPDASSCGEFYTWEGSDESGYQLKVFSLKKNGQEPASTLTPEQESLVCNETIFNKLPTDPGYNYDCREFYSQDGTVSYHLYTRTISCSDNCHPYRREVANETECTSGNGTWDSTNQRCLYYAVPGEGTTCSADQVGCREYTGNIASDIRVVLNDDFENSNIPVAGWNGAVSSSTSLNLGGHSIVGSDFSKRVGNLVTKDLSYTISFLAKASSGNSINLTGISLTNDKNQSANFSFSGVTVNNEWKLYTFNLSNLDHDVSANSSENSNVGELLGISFSSDVYLDNIKLTEVPNRYYLIKDSWTTPDECDQTVTGSYALHYMLGCSQYQDTDGVTTNLHSFSQLCQDSAAGCEQMIDTQNSSNYVKKLYNDTNNNGTCDTNEPNCVAIDQDKMINVVYDKTKQCDQDNKGCQRLGKVNNSQTGITYTDVYKLNNPDNYNTSLCTQAGVGCQAWSNGNGYSYFKDPGDRVCEYAKNIKFDNVWGWYKAGIKRCGGLDSGKTCQSDTDCSAPQTCQQVACATSLAKTIGLGGDGNKVYQPTTDSSGNNWAGLCEANESGCTEYIDPVSRFNSNILTATDWHNGSQILSQGKVDVSTLYILKGAGSKVTDWGNNHLYQLNPKNNQFEEVVGNENFVVVPEGVNSTEFFITKDNNSNFDGFTISGNSAVTELRKAIIGYQLKQNIDRSPTVVDFKSGKVLFNERSVSGANRQALIYNADQTALDSPLGNSPSTSGQLNANVILKVSPDRSCDKWLACRSYGVDANNQNKQTCFDIGLCNSLSPNGECNNFIDFKSSDVKNNLFDSANSNIDSISNLTGYSKVGYTGNFINSDMYNLSTMRQRGTSLTLSNGSFEDFDQNGVANWSLSSGASVIYKSSDTQNVANNDGTLPDGSKVLKLDGGENALSSTISLSPNTQYIISLYIYKRSGSAHVEINGNTVINNANDSLSNQWVRKVNQFTTTGATSYQIKLISDSGENYFDDVRIESALWYRCSDPSKSQDDCGTGNSSRWYLGSSCRLYPKADSLACMYNDSSTNTTQKGWRGYCLEWDPKNSQSCLLWYPLDKISSDSDDDSAALSVSSLGYCLQANDYCTDIDQSGDRARVYCSSFATTNNGYWRTRWVDDSSYVLPRDVTTTMKVDLGRGAIGKINDEDEASPVITVNDLNRSNSYGADSAVHSGEKLLSYNGTNLNFFPLYASLIYNKPTSMCRDDRSFAISKICGNCEATGPENQNHYGSLCLGRNGSGECSPPDSNDGCKMLSIYNDNNRTRYDDCYPNLGTPGKYAYGATTDGSGRWGYDAFDRDCKPSPESRCGFYTKQFDNAASSIDQSKEFIKRLFVSGSYYNWSNTVWEDSGNWAKPTIACYQGKRPTYNTQTRKCTAADGVTTGSCLAGNPGSANSTNDYCYVLPKIFNVKFGKYNITGVCANNKNQPCTTSDDCSNGAICSNTMVINGADYVNLKFNSKIDPDQLPLARYLIDWDGNNGNGGIEKTDIVSGSYDKPNENNPHSFRAYFDYSLIKNSSSSSCYAASNNNCPGRECCVVTPKISIWDNWGFYKEVSPVKIIVTKY